MKIDVTKEGLICLQEVFNPILLETLEGRTFAICMREDGIEVKMRDTEGCMKTFYLANGQCVDLAEQAKATELSLSPNVEPTEKAQSEAYDSFKDFAGIAL